MLPAAVAGLGSGGLCTVNSHIWKEVGVFEGGGGRGGSLHGEASRIMVNGHMGTTSEPIDRQT